MQWSQVFTTFETHSATAYIIKAFDNSATELSDILFIVFNNFLFAHKYTSIVKYTVKDK